MLVANNISDVSYFPAILKTPTPVFSNAGRELSPLVITSITIVASVLITVSASASAAFSKIVCVSNRFDAVYSVLVKI